MNPVIVANLWIGAGHLDGEIAVLNGYEVFRSVENNGAGVIILRLLGAHGRVQATGGTHEACSICKLSQRAEIRERLQPLLRSVRNA